VARPPGSGQTLLSCPRRRGRRTFKKDEFFFGLEGIGTFSEDVEPVNRCVRFENASIKYDLEAGVLAWTDFQCVD